MVPANAQDAYELTRQIQLTLAKLDNPATKAAGYALGMTTGFNPSCMITAANLMCACA